MVKRAADDDQMGGATSAPDVVPSPPTVQAARDILSVRQAMTAVLPAHVMVNPALDILMMLFAAPARMLAEPVLHAHSGVGRSTAVRWVRALAGEGLVVGSDVVRLTAKGVDAVERALAAAMTTMGPRQA